MTADEALDTIRRVYVTPLVEPVREELAALREERDAAIIECAQWKSFAAADTADLDAARAEVDALRHDVERHVRIASEQATEIEQLRALLSSMRNRDGVWEWRERIDAALKEQK